MQATKQNLININSHYKNFWNVQKIKLFNHKLQIIITLFTLTVEGTGKITRINIILSFKI